MSLVPALCHACSVLYGDLFFVVEEEVEVFRFELVKLELVVLDLIPAEVLSRSGGRCQESDNQGSEESGHRKTKLPVDHFVCIDNLTHFVLVSVHLCMLLDRSTG